MDRRLGDLSARVPLVAARVLGLLVALLVPTMLAMPGEAGVATALAAVVLSVGLAALFARRGALVAPTTATARPPRSGARQTYLARRLADPVRSPLRPRAPGLA